MNNPTITQEDVLEYIGQAAFKDVQAIAGAVRDRQKIVKYEAKAEYTVGDKASLVGLTPQYINGARVVIVGVHVSKFSVRLADPDMEPARVRNRLYGTFKVPMTCLER